MKRDLTNALADWLAGGTFFGVIFAILALALAGCATDQGPAAKVPEKVLVPVRQPCIPADVPPPPAQYADHDLGATPDPAERLRKIGQANQERKARLTVLEPAVAACR